MVTDQIADMFTRIRNAISAQRRTVTVPASKMKKELTRILFENSFITKYAFVDGTKETKQAQIKILLRYDDQMRNAIQGIERVSTPGRRQYATAERVPKVLNGMGIAIVSTSRGLVTDKDCRKLKIGGEVVGKVW
jgi:small subunit ribosomal protein S8